MLIHQILLKKTDSANLKSDLDKLDIDKLKNVSSNFSNLKGKVDKLDVDKLVPVPADVCKLSDAVKNNVVKKDVYNVKINDIEDKIPDITNLATNITLNAKINEIKNEIASTISLSRHEQVCLMRLIKEVCLMRLLFHDMINLLYYEHRTDKQKYFLRNSWYY